MAFYIPEPIIKRLPMYYRYLREMENENKLFVSSKELSCLTGVTASQVRQDFSAFGGEGRPGCGYPVSELRRYLAELLGMNRVQKLTIIGMGNLGRALVRYKTFSQNNFLITSVFDNSLQKVGMHLGSLRIHACTEMEAVLREQPADIAVLTVPAAAAQPTAEQLYQYGVRGFWNFAPVDLHLPKDASVVNVHLDESLELLSYRLAHPDSL